MLQIKEAIESFNNQRKEGQKKMTQSSLASLVMPDEKESYSKYYLSQWCNNKQLTRLRPEDIISIAIHTKTSPNFLLGWDQKKK